MEYFCSQMLLNTMVVMLALFASAQLETFMQVRAHPLSHVSFASCPESP